MNNASTQHAGTQHAGTQHLGTRDASAGGPQGLAPTARKWPVGVVLLVALALALAVPLANRAFGADDKPTFPGCGIAAWTGTCTCMIQKNGTAMPYDDFALMMRRPGVAPRGADPEAILADARKTCRIDRPRTRSAAQ